MVLIPFIYFFFLFYYCFKRNGFDVSAFMSLLFAITSFAAIFLYSINDELVLGENFHSFKLNLLPTLIYCGLISLFIFPFIVFNSNRKRNLRKLKNDKVFCFVANIFIFSFFFLLILNLRDIIERTFFSNFGDVRQMAYTGELSSAADKYDGLFRIVITLFEIFGRGSYFMIIFFYYSISRLNKSNLYNNLLLLSSTTPIFLSLLIADRSTTVFWILLFVLGYLLFRPYFSTSQKIKLKRYCFIGGGVLFAYLLMVTVARFADSSSGVGVRNSLIDYLGQPYLYFCNFWENRPDMIIYPYRLFPIISHYFVGDAFSIIDYVELYRTVGLNINVFSSFIGVFLLDFGQLPSVVISIALALASSLVVRKNNKESIGFENIIIVFALGSIVVCGIINYFYSSFTIALCFWFFILFSKLLFKSPK